MITCDMIYIVEYMSNRPIIFVTYEFSQDYLSPTCVICYVYFCNGKVTYGMYCIKWDCGNLMKERLQQCFFQVRVSTEISRFKMIDLI